MCNNKSLCQTQDPKTLLLFNNEEESTQSPQQINIEIIKVAITSLLDVFFCNTSQIKKILIFTYFISKFLNICVQLYIHNNNILYFLQSSSRFITILYCLL